jgi:hypothetical protein
VQPRRLVDPRQSTSPARGDRRRRCAASIAPAECPASTMGVRPTRGRQAAPCTAARASATIRSIGRCRAGDSRSPHSRGRAPSMNARRTRRLSDPRPAIAAMQHRYGAERDPSAGSHKSPPDGRHRRSGSLRRYRSGPRHHVAQSRPPAPPASVHDLAPVEPLAGVEISGHALRAPRPHRSRGSGDSAMGMAALRLGSKATSALSEINPPLGAARSGRPRRCATGRRPSP